jgi:hypothetical protein
MFGLEQDEDETGTVFRDVIMLALAGFVAMVILLLPHLNPPGKAAQENTQPPGNVIVEVRWPDDIDCDVDLWVEAPGDIPVGYSNKGGVGSGPTSGGCPEFRSRSRRNPWAGSRRSRGAIRRRRGRAPSGRPPRVRSGPAATS